MPDQLDLFGTPTGTPAAAPRNDHPRDPAKEPSIEERYEAFHAENPHVLVEMLRMARERLARGDRRIGVKGLWEDLRSWLQTTGQPYKLNNSFTAIYARELVKLEPQLEGVIEFRRRKS